MKKILNKSQIIKIVIIILILCIVYFIFTIFSIGYYLKEYGYSISELPKTVAVYFHFSNGFTVDETNDDQSIFIGRHNYIYDNFFKECGYYEVDRYGDSRVYTKIVNGEYKNIYVYSTYDWCHWFRIYKIDGAKIEDFVTI